VTGLIRLRLCGIIHFGNLSDETAPYELDLSCLTRLSDKLAETLAEYNGNLLSGPAPLF